MCSENLNSGSLVYIASGLNTKLSEDIHYYNNVVMRSGGLRTAVRLAYTLK